MNRIQKNLLAALGLACALPALAHVGITPNSAPAGAYQTLAFRVGHGCDGSATTAITVQLPDGIASAKPMPKTGWNIAIVDGKREVTWRGGPLPDAWFDEFTLLVKLPDAPGRYPFKVVQQCEQGRNDWVEVPLDAAKSKFPAPVLEVTAPDPHAGHHH